MAVDYRREIVQRILADVKALKPMPTSAMQVLKLLEAPAVDVKTLERLITTDQALTANLLHLANSAYFASAQPCASVSAAIMHVGFKQLRSILYLAPPGSVRGLVTDEVMQAHGATLARDWRTAQSMASSRPLDALLIDAALLDSMSPPDMDWLRSQFHDGVTIVGLGVEDDRLAPILGLKTLRAPAEANVPISPMGYRLVSALVLGDPEYVRAMEESGWIDRAIRGDTDGPTPTTDKPAISDFRKSRGRLDTQQELDVLFFRIRTDIEGAYQMRAEFQQQMKDATKEK